MEEGRDRVNSVFQTSTIFVARSDLKLAYIEVIHPLLSKKLYSVFEVFLIIFESINSCLRQYWLPVLVVLHSLCLEQQASQSMFLRAGPSLNFFRKELRSYDAKKL